MLLPIDSLRRDGGTQPRANINLDTAYEYGEEMKAGSKFPAVVSFYDGTAYWLADGFHRVEGAFSAGLDQIECDVHQGTLEDAQWYSFGVNKSHGLRRTNEDKQRAVKAALAHPKSAALSDHQIAKHVGVAVSTVGDWRKKSDPTIGNLQSPKRECADGRTINTANIGKRPQSFDGGTRVTIERSAEPVAALPASRKAEIEPDRGDVAIDADLIAEEVSRILDSGSTPAEIAAYVVAQQLDISTWEDARDFLSAVIEKTKRG